MVVNIKDLSIQNRDQFVKTGPVFTENRADIYLVALKMFIITFITRMLYEWLFQN